MGLESQKQNFISISSKPRREDQYFQMPSIDESNDDEMHSNGSMKDRKHSECIDDFEPGDPSGQRKVLAEANKQCSLISLGSASLSARSSVSDMSNQDADKDLY